jgi:hemolysin III
MTPCPLRGLARYFREPVNSLTHLVGALLSLVGLVVLLVLAAGEPWRTVSFAIYGTTLVLLYTASTLLHSLHVGARAQRRLRLFDHAAIFLLIAGSYTPITLVTLQQGSGAWGWTLFALVWGIAVLGVVFKLVWLEAPRWLSTGLYLLMGWLALLAIVPITRALPPGGLFWLLLGGLFYSVGAVVYGLKRPNWLPGVFGYHELWHLFVLAGSISHFLMMLLYVLPVA